MPPFKPRAQLSQPAQPAHLAQPVHHTNASWPMPPVSQRKLRVLHKLIWTWPGHVFWGSPELRLKSSRRLALHLFLHKPEQTPDTLTHTSVLNSVSGALRRVVAAGTAETLQAHKQQHRIAPFSLMRGGPASTTRWVRHNCCLDCTSRCHLISLQQASNATHVLRKILMQRLMQRHFYTPASWHPVQAELHKHKCGKESSPSNMNGSEDHADCQGLPRRQWNF